MSLLHRLAAAASRRVHGPYLALERLESRLDDVARESAGRLDELQSQLASLGQIVSGEVGPVLRALVAEESANRRRLYRLRESADYDAAWTEPAPLVTVTVATRARPRLLAERSLPSILGQTYGNLEVIVVGDAADEATAEAVNALGDPRVTYRNLTQRLEFTTDPNSLWLVASTLARNEAMRLASGSWVVCFDDDDAMAPNCVERLLSRARDERFEVAYGRASFHMNGHGQDLVVGGFPPRLGDFTWASGIYHAGLRFFARELHAADLGLPGDWYLAERMLRAGVRFGYVDETLADCYPSRVHGPEAAS